MMSLPDGFGVHFPTSSVTPDAPLDVQVANEPLRIVTNRLTSPRLETLTAPPKPTQTPRLCCFDHPLSKHEDDARGLGSDADSERV